MSDVCVVEKYKKKTLTNLENEALALQDLIKCNSLIRSSIGI